MKPAVLLGSAAAVALATCAVNFSAAQPPETGDDTSHPGQQSSLLQQLSDETQRVYGKARQGLVRVQLPTPQWLEQINEQKRFLNKWGNRLDPAVREKLLEQQERALVESRQRQGAVSSTEPSKPILSLPGGDVPATRPASTTPSMMPPTMPQSEQTNSATPATQPAEGLRVVDGRATEAGRIILVATALLVDDKGHAVIPFFVDRKDFGSVPLAAVTADGQPTTAKFVGADRKTNLTVVELENHNGKPVALGHTRPDDGTLTLVIAPEGGAKLVVWTNTHPEPGLAVLPDGTIAGFGFDGHFLGASTAKPIVDQLIATGEVHRAALGVMIIEVGKEDLSRQMRSELGSKSAIRVMGVDKDSAAARGGVEPDDLILAIGGEAVSDAPTFAAVIATRSGDTVLRVLRGTRTIDLTVNLKPE